MTLRDEATDEEQEWRQPPATSPPPPPILQALSKKRPGNPFGSGVGDDLESVPPAADRRWKRWTRPLLAFLARPRRWVQMAGWADRNGIPELMLRQLFAALEERGEAECVAHLDARNLMWRRRAKKRAHDWVVPPPREERERPDRSAAFKAMFARGAAG